MKKTIFVFLLLLFMSAVKAEEKYAIGMFHFNFQYVAGNYKIERRIIEQSLYPVLQFFEKNPDFKSDIEMQGYAIEVLAEEHPQVLKLLKKLVDRGQIELVIAHYSDQFFIAYPALDLQKSIEINDLILAKHELKRSRVFFGQEIQWTPAYPSVLKGKYDVVVTSSDPHNWYRDKTLPLVDVRYGEDHILGLIDSEKELPGLKWAYAFLDDGEVFNTLDYRSDFYPVPAQEKESIDRFKQLKAEGYKFVTMTELVEKIKSLPGYQIPKYPFVPEGTWNMSVCGPYMWMGRQRSGVETDGVTRAICYDARNLLLAVEKLMDYAASLGFDVKELKVLLEKAWRHLLLAEVSDSSGWTPWASEVQYTANEVTNVKKVLKEISDKLNVAVLAKNTTLKINTADGKVTNWQAVTTEPGKTALFPVGMSIRAEKYSVSVKQFGDKLYRMDIHCDRPADGAVEIVFDTAEKGLYYSAGAGEHIAVEIPTDLKHDPALALSNGFIYLNNGYNLVKDCSVEHLAATWKMKDRKLVFRQELNEENHGMNMRFYLLKGSVNDGLQLGNLLNTSPFFTVKEADGKLVYEKIMPENANF
jgi:hypothetical protein